jgi:hypothetical protein
MGREDDGPAFGNVALVLDEDRAASLEVADDVSVVDDLLAHVYGRPVQVEELFDRVNSAFNPGAIAAGRREENPLDHAVSVVRPAEAPSLRTGPRKGRARRSGGQCGGPPRLLTAAFVARYAQPRFASPSAEKVTRLDFDVNRPDDPSFQRV